MRNKFKKIGITLLIFFVIGIIGSFLSNDKSNTNISNNKVASTKQDKSSSESENNAINKLASSSQSTGSIQSIENLKVHYINVGQGDSILIQQGEHTMLIDAGTNASEQTVINYLNNQKIKKLDYVIGTHPHEDHIGGMDKVIDSFRVDKVIMPKVTANTQTFKSIITSIKNKGLKISTPHVGDKYKLGNADFTILAPNKDKYDKTNNYSIVSKLKFGNNSFIFTGDAESLSEGEILQKQLDLYSDVLKVGHHGSKTSTTQEFLNKVDPKYAVISCGKGNKYGHPTQETLKKLKAKNIKLYRTDECGNVVATSDGTNIVFNCNEGSFKEAHVKNINKPVSKASVKQNTKVISSTPGTNTSVHKNTIGSTQKQTLSQSNNQGQQVWLSATGSKYHAIPNCGRINPNKARQISIGQAQSEGYEACRKCMH